MSRDIDALLKRLGLGAVNAGAWSGSRGWSDVTHAALMEVRNPADGTLLAQVRPASAQDYEHVLSSAVDAAAAWRDVPAPKRGETVRLLGEQLRRHKRDRKSTRLNSSHSQISYAGFCLKKKKK